ncbi:MAG: SsrA-binding protein SmpB [Acidobacteriota bacterium]
MPYSKVLTTNRQARFNYFILDSIEAGLVLRGTEVKSLRLGLCNLKDSYARLQDSQAWLYNCHISPYPHGNRMNHEPLRPRKLLLRKAQIRRLERQLTKGMTLVALRIYLKDKRIKVELGLGRGKKHFDKRAALKEKAIDRDTRAAMHSRRR